MAGVYRISLIYEDNNFKLDKALDEFYENGKWRTASLTTLEGFTDKVLIETRLKMELYSELAEAYRMLDNPASMIQYAVKAIEVAKELDEKPYVAWNYATLGGSFIFLGDYETAKEIVSKIFDVSKEGDFDHEWIQETANIYMAEILVNTGENEEARKHLEESYKYIDKEVGDYKEMMDKRKVLEAVSYLNEGDYEHSEEILNTIDINALKTNERFRAVVIPYLATMSEILLKRGYIEESIEHTEEILKICEEQNMKFHELQYLKRILPLYFEKKPTVALHYQERFFQDYAFLIAENNSVTSKFILKTFDNVYEGKKHSEREVIAVIVTSLAIVFAISMSYLLAKSEYINKVDYLTKGYNRGYYNKIYSKLKANAEEFAVIIMDLDFFKKINDEFGHNIGDLVLSEFSSQIIEIMESDKYFFRMGGEEF